MNKIILLVIIGVAAVSVLIFLLGVQVDRTARAPRVENPKTLSSQETVPTPTALETKANNEGPATVSVRPTNIFQSNSEWDFEITLDTHSYGLSDDLMQAAELLDNQGNRYKPIAWEGDPPGGHHREGGLKFRAITPFPRSLTLIIRDIGGVVSRTFTWTLQ